MSCLLTSIGSQADQTPFALLSPSSNSIIYYDQSTGSHNMNKVQSNSITTLSEVYCETAFVYPNSYVGSGGYIKFYAVGHDQSYKAALIMHKDSASGTGAFNRPHADDISLSWDTSFSWTYQGYVVSVTQSDSAKSHAIMITMRL